MNAAETVNFWAVGATIRQVFPFDTDFLGSAAPWAMARRIGQGLLLKRALLSLFGD